MKLVCCFVFLLTLVHGGVTQTVYISTCDQLQALKDNPTADAVLTQNIDCSPDRPGNNNTLFTPIGTTAVKFRGSVNGSGYEISNVHIYAPTTDAVGLFGHTHSLAVLTNIKLITVNVTGNRHTGGLAGYSEGLIEHCLVIGTVQGLGDNTGGVVGRHTGQVRYASVNVVVLGGTTVGGLMGLNNGGTVMQSAAFGTVLGTRHVGGLIGSSNLGGGTVNDCMSLATVSGITVKVGGLLGENSGTVRRAYSAGKVSGPVDETGGLLGQSSGSVIECHWDIETSNQTRGVAGLGNTTAAMYRQSTYRGWDFVQVWEIEEGVGYPRLQQSVPVPRSTSVSHSQSISPSASPTPTTSPMDITPPSLTLLNVTAVPDLATVYHFTVGDIRYVLTSQNNQTTLAVWQLPEQGGPVVRDSWFSSAPVQQWVHIVLTAEQVQLVAVKGDGENTELINVINEAFYPVDFQLPPATDVSIFTKPDTSGTQCLSLVLANGKASVEIYCQEAVARRQNETSYTLLQTLSDITAIRHSHAFVIAGQMFLAHAKFEDAQGNHVTESPVLKWDAGGFKSWFNITTRGATYITSHHTDEGDYLVTAESRDGEVTDVNCAVYRYTGEEEQPFRKIQSQIPGHDARYWTRLDINGEVAVFALTNYRRPSYVFSFVEYQGLDLETPLLQTHEVYGATKAEFFQIDDAIYIEFVIPAAGSTPGSLALFVGSASDIVPTLPPSFSALSDGGGGKGGGPFLETSTGRMVMIVCSVTASAVSIGYTSYKCYHRYLDRKRKRKYGLLALSDL